jgi:phosphoenolpyruvate carboxykinase (ATP)
MTEGTEKREFLTEFRVIAESAFYMNNVEKVNTIAKAYKLAVSNPGTIVVDQKVYQPEKIGFPKGANVLLFNDGDVAGRTSAARKILGDENVSKTELSGKLREAVFGLSRKEKVYHAQSIIGLHEDFMVKANLLIPKGYENNILSWLSNFQEINQKYSAMYKKSKQIKENDIFIVTDPEWTHPEHPYGLAFFSPLENTAFILGMRYFGELKKGTLTLGWGIANRNGYASCHGGLKSYDSSNYVAAFFGLSGSGKSTLTHAKHGGKYKVTILHDDAFIINDDTHCSIALEPAYFDKTSDYKIGSEDNKYIVTAQNVGVTQNKKGEKILVTEDIRNTNGRAVKSRLWSPNRVDKINKKINAVFWLMKDPCVPPLLKINDPVLASTLGATLATKRTSAERLAKGVDPNALVFEPYANPFRTYPLRDDYNKFKILFEKGVDCYILNTGHFMDVKVQAKDTLGLIEALIDKKGLSLDKMFGIDVLEYATGPDIKTPEATQWKADFIGQIQKRIDYIDGLTGREKLPEETKESLVKVIDALKV